MKDRIIKQYHLGTNSYGKKRHKWPRQSLKGCSKIIRYYSQTSAYSLVLDFAFTRSHSTKAGMYWFQFIHATKSGDTKWWGWSYCTKVISWSCETNGNRKFHIGKGKVLPLWPSISIRNWRPIRWEWWRSRLIVDYKAQEDVKSWGKQICCQ